MKITDLGGFRTIKQYTNYKLETYAVAEKSMKTLYGLMFSESENIMAEFSDGYKTVEVTYGECKREVERLSAVIGERLSVVPECSAVGLYMENSLLWIQVFWALLKCGYKPVLMNLSLPIGTIESIIDGYSVKAVISDGKKFSVHTEIASELGGGDASAAPEKWADEVIFMSSGTTGEDSVKLCSYTGENFYYQICSSARIIAQCPQIKKHYNGRIKLLTLLPLYHVFGFIAVYLWFGFFARTFVFLKDLNPQTILNTVRRHKVTHFFAVPLVWETVYKTAMRTIRARGNKIYKRFTRGLKLSNATGLIPVSAFSEVRDNIFGDSIRFLISGGSSVSEDTLKFFNGIGYHLADGYGMTEIGITSVELSHSKRKLNSASVGKPFKGIEYAISADGELLVRGRSIASEIRQNGVTRKTDYTEWFNTHDLFETRGGRFYAHGRKDDLIIGPNGENVNPDIVERTLNLGGVDGYCLVAGADNRPVLVVGVENCYSAARLREAETRVRDAIRAAKLDRTVSDVAVTTDKLIEDGDFKINRKKIAKKLLSGALNVVDGDIESRIEEKLTQLERDVRKCFCEALDKSDDEITRDGNFFSDFGGTSFDYFVLMDSIKATFNVEIPVVAGMNLVTVNEVCEYIKTHN